MAVLPCGGCRRKKDHGRAEAMLLTAWALGLNRVPPPGAMSASRARRKVLKGGANPAPAPAVTTQSDLISVAQLDPFSAAQSDLAGNAQSHPASVPQLEPTGSATQPAAAATSAHGAAVAGQEGQGQEVQGAGGDAPSGWGESIQGGGAGHMAEPSANLHPVQRPPNPAEALHVEGVLHGVVISGVNPPPRPSGRLFSSDDPPPPPGPTKAEQAVAMLLEIEERAGWGWVQGVLRPARPTDGYGNPMPAPADGYKVSRAHVHSW